MILSPVLPSLSAASIGYALAGREPGYRTVSRSLLVLAALDAIGLGSVLLRAGASVPYTGLARGSWAISQTVWLAFGWTSVWLTYQALGESSQARRGYPYPVVIVVCSIVALVACSLILFYVYPFVRGAHIAHLLEQHTKVVAILQVAIGASWLSRQILRAKKSSTGSLVCDVALRIRSISISERIGLCFAAGASWDFGSTLKPFYNIIADWGLTSDGNMMFFGAICAFQAHKLMIAWST